jgi:hypothetical protein
MSATCRKRRVSYPGCSDYSLAIVETCGFHLRDDDDDYDNINDEEALGILSHTKLEEERKLPSTTFSSLARNVLGGSLKQPEVT